MPHLLQRRYAKIGQSSLNDRIATQPLTVLGLIKHSTGSTHPEDYRTLPRAANASAMAARGRIPGRAFVCGNVEALLQPQRIPHATASLLLDLKRITVHLQHVPRAETFGQARQWWSVLPGTSTPAKQQMSASAEAYDWVISTQHVSMHEFKGLA